MVANSFIIAVNMMGLQTHKIMGLKLEMRAI